MVLNKLFLSWSQRSQGVKKVNQKTSCDSDHVIIKRNQQFTGNEEGKEAKLKEDSLLKKFIQLRNNTIRPIMESVGEYLKAQGHDYHIHEEEELHCSGNNVRLAGITLKIFPADARYLRCSDYGFGNTPSLSFFAHRAEQKIMMYSCSKVPGVEDSSGIKVKGYGNNQITRDVVEREIIRILKNISNQSEIASNPYKVHTHQKLSNS
jgi:hypothetical protein